ncbi:MULTISPECIES: hypothetical protein [Paenibacillus]|uniref:hypothetical protein n=1 Tax=Paenibacillus TaxID=44249 RepID=UPI001FD4B9E3|nr:MULTISPECIES: hypothetical protein [Paenibacillus]
MKIKLDISNARYDEIKSALEERGIEIDDTADLVLSETNSFIDNLIVREKGTNARIILSVEDIDVALEDLIALGVIHYCVVKDNFIDNEYANVFLYKSNNTFDDFTLQEEEVAGIARAKFKDFTDLWFGAKKEIEISGFEIDKDGKRVVFKEHVSRDKFVPHQIAFYKEVILKIQQEIHPHFV